MRVPAFRVRTLMVAVVVLAVIVEAAIVVSRRSQWRSMAFRYHEDADYQLARAIDYDIALSYDHEFLHLLRPEDVERAGYVRKRDEDIARSRWYHAMHSRSMILKLKYERGSREPWRGLPPDPPIPIFTGDPKQPPDPHPGY